MPKVLSEEIDCRDCGQRVRWCESKAGKRYLGQPLYWEAEGHERTYWPSHACVPNPEWRQQHAAQQAAELAASIAAGEIVKGAPVVVVKGRKVPHGVAGVVFWIGEDCYGKARVGFKTEAEEIVYTALSNLALAV
jgi:hypothetical protein